jgi:hypothetical protein
VRGVLRRRLLVNAVVDPEEAALRLPAGLRPHVTALGTVVGCCLLDITELRPRPLPAAVGIRQRAAAHRISVEWGSEHGETIVGVWVPDRRTDARLAVALGGRWFPGVHKPADVSIDLRADGLSWRFDDAGDFLIDVDVSVPCAPVEVCEVVAGTCLAATVGISADHRGGLEAARMQPDHRNARQVVVEKLESRFIEGFRSAVPAPTYLMENVSVTWTPARRPSAIVMATT